MIGKINLLNSYISIVKIMPFIKLIYKYPSHIKSVLLILKFIMKSMKRRTFQRIYHKHVLMCIFHFHFPKSNTKENSLTKDKYGHSESKHLQKKENEKPNFCENLLTKGKDGKKNTFI